MSDEINNKLNELIDSIDNNESVIKMKRLKEDMYNDQNLKELLDKFRNLDNTYTDEYINLKKEILSNSTVREYKELENQLYFTVLEINKRLNTLMDRKRCSL